MRRVAVSLAIVGAEEKKIHNEEAKNTLVVNRTPSDREQKKKYTRVFLSIVTGMDTGTNSGSQFTFT